MATRITNEETEAVACMLENALRSHGLIGPNDRAFIGTPYGTDVWRAYVQAPSCAIVPVIAIDAPYNSRREAVLATRAATRALFATAPTN